MLLITSSDRLLAFGEFARYPAPTADSAAARSATVPGANQDKER